MADLIDLSSRIIDSGTADEPVNRITNQLSEIADGVAIVESFSHSVIVDTADGLVVFDTSGKRTGERVVEALRGWSKSEIHTVVYTHGHVDHVGGSGAFVADAESHRHRGPTFVGHESIPRRFARYRLTDGYNRVINARQFGGVSKAAVGSVGLGDGTPFLPDDTAELDVAYANQLTVPVGELSLDLRHARGETDDHTWTWIPSKKMIAAGDLMIWNFPNCGNPQKVQRYPAEWAVALREMASMGAELFVPAHGLPIGGAARISSVLNIIAETLEQLLAKVLDAMNAGAPLDEVVQECRVPHERLALPYLRPLYDEPEFVVRNIWRQYGGWWDGDPAALKPPPGAALAAEVATLAGGAVSLADRAVALADAGELRVACQLAEWAAKAEPESVDIHRTRAAVYEMRREAEASLMAKGIFASAVAESQLAIDPDGDVTDRRPSTLW